jgi:hypothetical protein
MGDASDESIGGTMITLKVDDTFKVLVYIDENGPAITTVAIGDVFELLPGRCSDDGELLEKEAKVKIEKIIIPPAASQAWIIGSLPNSKRYSGPLAKSIDSKSREYVIGIHNGCGGNIIKRRECSWCDKCKEYLCGCASM